VSGALIDEGGLTRPLRLCDERGGAVGGDWRWLGPAAFEDERLLDRAVGPVLDVGCGPGRHLVALARRGVEATGIDVTPAAVSVARSRGARVVEGSIFGPVPAPGTWATALLLDGNVGIGGDPVTLLRRVASLLTRSGRILVELGDPAAGSSSIQARIEHGAVVGPWFEWVTVDTGAIGVIAARAGLKVKASWSGGGRRFAQLQRCARRRR